MLSRRKRRRRTADTENLEHHPSKKQHRSPQLAMNAGDACQSTQNHPNSRLMMVVMLTQEPGEVMPPSSIKNPRTDCYLLYLAVLFS
jgi:hypothetical protein